MQILAKILIETQKLSDAQRSKQKRHRQSRGVNRQHQNSPSNRVAGRRERQNRCKDWPDARCPTKCESESQQKRAPNARLSDFALYPHIAIKPARHRRTKKTYQRQRKKVDRAKPREKRSMP